MFQFTNFDCFEDGKILRGQFRQWWFGMAAFQQMKSLGFLAFLFSTENTRGFQQLNDSLQDPNTGVERQVLLLNRTPYCYQLACADWTCEDEVNKIYNTPDRVPVMLPKEPCFLTTTDDPSKPAILSWNPDDFKKLCVDQGALLAEQLGEQVIRLEELLERKYLEKLNTDLIPDACDSQGNTNPSVRLFVEDTRTPDLSTPNPAAFLAVEADFIKAYQAGSYAIIGGMRIWQYMKRRKLQNGGAFNPGNADLSMNDGTGMSRFYYSYAYDDVFDPNTFLTIKDGVLQVIQYSYNKGYKERESNAYDRWTYFRTPIGLLVDQDWHQIVTGTGRRCTEINIAIYHTGDLYAAPGGGCDIPDCYNGILKWTDCGINPFGVPCPDTNACATLGFTSTTATMASYSAVIADADTNVLTINGIQYAATAGNDPIAAAAEIQALLRAIWPTATVVFVPGAGTGTITVSGIPVGSVVTWENSVTTPAIALVQNGTCQVLQIATTSTETLVIVDESMTTIYNGDPSITQDVPVPSVMGSIQVQGGNVYISTCNTSYTAPHNFTVTAKNATAGCSDYIGIATLEQAPAKTNPRYGSTVLDLSEGTYTQAQILSMLAANPAFKMSDGTQLNAANAYISEWSIGQVTIKGEYYDTVAMARQETGASGGTITDNGFTTALNDRGSRLVGKRNIYQDMAITVDADAAVVFVFIVEEKY